MNQSELVGILAQVKCDTTRFADWKFDFIMHPVSSQSAHGPEGWVIQCSFERPDADSGEMNTGYGRHWLIAEGSTETSIVKTAWLAMKQVVEHELMEAFTWQRSRIFDPHKSLEALAYNGRVPPQKGES